MFMKYEKFMEVLLEKVRYSVKVLCFPVPEAECQTIVKNNQVLIDKISFTIPGSEVGKSYDMKTLYDDYRDGKSMEEIVEDLCTEVMTPVPETLVHLKENIKDYHWIRDKLFVHLVNTEANMALLQAGPHRSFGDLSVIYRIILSDEDQGVVSTHILNDMLKYWHIEEEQLYTDALENTMTHYPLFFEDLSVLFEDMKLISAIDPGDDSEGKVNLNILSNRSFFCGAGVMLYPHVLDRVAMTLGGEIYILPSSIHEVLVISADRVDDPEYLKRMVREVNDSVVPEEDFLSNEVYIYSEYDQRLRMV